MNILNTPATGQIQKPPLRGDSGALTLYFLSRILWVKNRREFHPLHRP